MGGDHLLEQLLGGAVGGSPSSATPQLSTPGPPPGLGGVTSLSWSSGNWGPGWGGAPCLLQAQHQPLGAAPCVPTPAPSPPPDPALSPSGSASELHVGHQQQKAKPWGGQRQQWSLAFGRLHCGPGLSAALLGSSAPACGLLLSQTRLRVAKKTSEFGNCDHC